MAASADRRPGTRTRRISRRCPSCPGHYPQLTLGGGLPLHLWRRHHRGHDGHHRCDGLRTQLRRLALSLDQPASLTRHRIPQRRVRPLPRLPDGLPPRPIHKPSRLDARVADSFVRKNRRAYKVIQLRKFLVHIRVAALEYLVLMSGTHTAARVFAVAAVDLLHDIPALNNLAERSESRLGIVQRGVVAEVDVNLRGARSGTCVRKGYIAGLVMNLEGVIRDRFVAPG